MGADGRVYKGGGLHWRPSAVVFALRPAPMDDFSAAPTLEVAFAAVESAASYRKNFASTCDLGDVCWRRLTCSFRHALCPLPQTEGERGLMDSGRPRAANSSAAAGRRPVAAPCNSSCPTPVLTAADSAAASPSRVAQRNSALCGELRRAVARPAVYLAAPAVSARLINAPPTAADKKSRH